MGKIVAIGGGDIKIGDTEEIDRFIVHLSNKSDPKLLFVPTASYDSENYIETVKEHFTELGCLVNTLCLVTNTYTDEEIASKILSADIIYVGGGDTARMMEKWKECKVDLYLRQAYKKGIVLSGLSAGSICWFIFGHSDSNSFFNEGQWGYIKVYGLGLIAAAHCPHYNEEGRKGFDDMIKEENIKGIALEDRTAFVEIDGEYYILKSDKESKAYFLKNNIFTKVELPEGKISDNLFID